MELEEFAFQGCPDVRGPQTEQSPKKALNNDGEDKNVSSIKNKRETSQSVISKLTLLLATSCYRNRC